MKFVIVSSVFVFSFRQFRYTHDPLFMQWYNYSHAFTIAKIIDSCSTYTYMLSPSFHYSARLSLSRVCSAWFSCSTLRKYLYRPTSAHLKRINFFSFLSDACLCIWIRHIKIHETRLPPPPPQKKKIIYYINGEIPTGFRLKFPVEESSWILWQLS